VPGDGRSAADPHLPLRRVSAQGELAKVAMDGIDARDTMYFPAFGKWWMFTNIDPSPLRDHCSDLFIYSASSPLADEWMPHPRNPVVVDALSGRNGGLLRSGNQVYRVAQEQGFDMYGRRSKIFRIDVLTDTAYAESLVSEIEPTFFKGIRGTHHLHGNDKLTVFDFVAFERGM
jgi:hypothetical protein